MPGAAVIRRTDRIRILLVFVPLSTLWPSLGCADLSSLVRLNIAPQELPSAILQYSEQSGIQVTGAAEVLEHKSSPGAAGLLQAQAALDQLLAGTHLEYHIIDRNTVAIRAPATPPSTTQTDNTGPREDTSRARKENALARSASNPRQGAAGVPNDTEELQTISITASKLRSLEQFTPTASRLVLSARETPVTLDTVDSDQIIGRGLHSVKLAVDTLPGVTSGGSPGDPAELSMRGFTGNQITVLFNGLYIGPSNFVNRPGNSFNLASVEILKGPASMLYGQGAVGGVVNAVNKGPTFGKPQTELLLSYGSFGSTDVGVGVGTHFADTLAVRCDLSRTSTQGYVHDASADSLNGTVSVLWRPISTLDVQLSFDYLKDHPSPYWGTPLVPVSFATHPLTGAIDPSGGLTIDERMRYVNYNVGDYRIRAEQYWPKLLLKWSVNDKLTLENHVYYFNAQRTWFDSETYTFNPATDLIDRDRSFVAHRQDLIGDQGSASYRDRLFGMKNELVVGFDFSHMRFLRTRGYGIGDSVDLFNPVRGSYGATQPTLSPTYWTDWASFFEDVLNITQQLKLVMGGRYDTFSLDRQNFDPDGAFDAALSFKRTFNFGTGRIGLTYDLTANLTPYASFTTARDPGGSSLFVVTADENFGPSSSYQVELGIKGNNPAATADFTLASYFIKRQHMVTQTGVDTFSTIGSQTSKGIEVTGDIRLTSNWTVSANGAYTDSVYGTFVDPATSLNGTGNQAANVPRWTSNVWTSYRNIGAIPLEVGAGSRIIGRRYGNPQNTLRLQPYVLLDVYASYNLTRNVQLSARLKNALNQTYVNWADTFYPAQAILGAPRSYEVSLYAKF